jgi:predicted DNA-binding WGR domain protein/uncharacterized protein YwqG
MKRHLEFKDDKSSKFWEIETNGKNFTVTFGKIGIAGQSQTKEFESEEKALKEAEKLVNEKLKKGYKENKSSGNNARQEKSEVKKENVKEKKDQKSLNLIDKAREIVMKQPLSDKIKFFAEEKYYFCSDNSNVFLDDKKIDADILSQSLHYFVIINCKKITDEKKVKLGISKLKGLPHLPDSIKWPEDNYFFAQINLKDLSKYDLENYLPKDGMLYIFLNPEESNLVCNLFYYNGKESLSVVNYPKGKMYYQEKFIKESSLMEFKPNSIFMFGSRSDYSKLSKIIDVSLKEKISKILKCDMSGDDSLPNIFGHPRYYQGEETINYKEYIKDINIKSPLLLLFQGEFGEGAAHFWIDKNDLKKKDFSECFVTYSGT